MFLRKRLCVLIVSYSLTQSLFSPSHIIRERRKERAQYKRLTWWSEFDCVPQEWSKNFAAASPPLLLPHDFPHKENAIAFIFPLSRRCCYITIILLAGWERRASDPLFLPRRGLPSANSRSLLIDIKMQPLQNNARWRMIKSTAWFWFYLLINIILLPPQKFI